MSGKIINLYLKSRHGASMEPVSSATAESGQGLVGDVSFGRAKRQVLLIEGETLDEFNLVPGQVKENVTVRGLALAGLPEGTRLQAGDVLLEVTGDCAPCQYIEDISPGLQDAIAGRRGTLARVLDGGTLRLADAIRILPTSQSA